MCWSDEHISKGWCVKGLKNSFHPDNAPDKFQPWSVGVPDLYCCIMDHYAKNPEPNLTIIAPAGDDDDDDDGEASYTEQDLYGP